MSTIKKALSTRVDVNGESQILFRVTISRETRIRIKSGVLVPVKNWDNKKECVKLPTMGGATYERLVNVQKSIISMEQKVLRLIQLFPDKDKTFIETTLELIKDVDSIHITRELVENIHERVECPELFEKIGFFDLASRYLQEKDVCEGRKRSFRVVFRSMARFEIYSQKVLKNGFKWDVESCTTNDLRSFFAYFKDEHILRERFSKVFDKILEQYPIEATPKHTSSKMQEKGDNYMHEIQKKVRSFFIWLRKKKYTKNNPFEDFEMTKEQYGTPYYLTLEERNHIADFDLSATPELEAQRDIFIFQCLVGCRVGDLYSFTRDNIVDGVLTYTPHKTEDGEKSFVANVPLNKRAASLLKKYEGVDKKGRLFPFISQQKYNDSIKTIFTRCGVVRMVNVRDSTTGKYNMRPINELASSHMARRTFIGAAYKLVQDPNIIGQMSGHVEGSKAFVRYRKIDVDILKNVVGAIE